MRVNYSEIFPPFSALLYFGTVERPRIHKQKYERKRYWEKLNKTLSLQNFLCDARQWWVYINAKRRKPIMTH